MGCSEEIRVITYQRETVDQVLPDLEQHFKAHWDEVASFKEYIVDGDYDRYRALEKSSMLVIATARCDKRLVGYAIDIIGTNLHYKQMKVASCDLHYIEPDFRARCARGLTKFIEKTEKDLGVFLRTTRTKEMNSADRFFAAMRYEVVETVWGKRL